MKLTLRKLALAMAASLSLAACGPSSGGGGGGGGGGDSTPSDMWGRWVSFGRNETWYVASDSIKIYDKDGALSSAYPVTSLSASQIVAPPYSLGLASKELLSVQGSSSSFKLMRASKYDLSVKGAVNQQTSGARSSRALRAAGGVSLVIQNVLNQADLKTTKTDEQGQFSVPNAIVGDEYKISIGASGKPVIIKPSFDGQLTGAITLRLPDVPAASKYNFKSALGLTKNTSLTTVETPTFFIIPGGSTFSDTSPNQVQYNFGVTTTNVGTAVCSLPHYEISIVDDKSYFGGSRLFLANDISSINPDAKVELVPKYSYLMVPYFADPLGFADMKVKLVITDLSNQSWEEYLTWRFYDRPAFFHLVEGSPGSGIRAVVRSVDGISQSLAPGAATMIPWQTNGKALVVVSGLDSSSSGSYYLSANGYKPVPAYNASHNVAEAASHGSEETAQALKDGDIVAGNLAVGEQDFYLVDFASPSELCPPGVRFAGLYKLRDLYDGQGVSYGDDDGMLETAYSLGNLALGPEMGAIDLAVCNTTGRKVQAFFKTSMDPDPYVEAYYKSSSYCRGNLQPGYVESLGGSMSATAGGDITLNPTYTNNSVMSLKVLAGCPVGHVARIKISTAIEDGSIPAGDPGSYDNPWIEYLEIPIE